MHHYEFHCHMTAGAYYSAPLYVALLRLHENTEVADGAGRVQDEGLQPRLILNM